MATKPTQIRIAPELLDRVDAAAALAGQSRTQWIVEALSLRLDGPPKTKRPLGGEEKCRHPVNRRIGDFCGACGEKSR